jgi:hypothetical protein
LGSDTVSTDSYAARAIAFLCWLDIFERIDTLMLEIRHVQETTASQLRVGSLYELFQYEDHYLWGRYASKLPRHDEQATAAYYSKDWFEVLNSHSWSSFSHFCTVLASLWCPEFPPASGIPVFYQTLAEKGETAAYERWFDKAALDAGVTQWREARVNISTKNLFSANDDRLYDALRYLQLLKRDILRDKLVMTYRALESLGQLDRVHSQSSLAHFLVVRRAALYSLHRRLDGFRDIVTTVQEILNLSMERDPPPTVWRRRDQGIYTTDLADNCHYIARTIQKYLATIRDADEAYLQRDPELEFIVHRYTRNYTSTYRYDNIWSRSDVGEQLSNIGAGFVQSSFWMPERPDLQPIIVHEIAHLLLKRHYGDLRPIELDGTNDLFAELLRDLSYVFERNASKFALYDFSPRTREGLLREIACDLIGVAVHGTSYLLAHFLEVICVGCEKLFQATPTGDIAQNIGQLGDEYITFISNDHPEWLARLPVTLAFWKLIRADYPQPVRHFESIIYDGINELIDATHRALSSWMDGDQKKDWINWSKMTIDLVNIVENSGLGKVTSTWLRSRSEFTTPGEKQNVTDAALDRYLRPLSEEIKASCLGAWLDRLVEAPRMLGTYLNRSHPPPSRVTYHQAIEAFRKLYLKWSVGEYKQDTALESHLFSHLIDIPWQTAILTVHDLLGTPPSRLYGISQEHWVTAIHEFNWLGRDLYHSALEFVIWHERPSIGRLKAMNRWLLSIRDMINGVEDVSIRALGTLLLPILGDDIPETSVVDKGRQVQGRLRPLFIKWGSDPTAALEAVDVGSQAICRFYAGHDAAFMTISNSDREKWIHFFDCVATAQMDFACVAITTGLRNFFRKHENSDLMTHVSRVLSRPIRNSEDIQRNRSSSDGMDHLQHGRIIIELVRVAHYLAIRPETSPAGPSTEHHADRPELTWDAVFAQYLDVPIHARKREFGGESTLLDRLRPGRSLRLDRFSQLYSSHLSSQALLRGSDASKCPGHLSTDTLLTGRSLFWVPWDSNGVRRDGGSGEYFTTFLGTPLLGRFDRLTLDMAKHTARFAQNLGAGQMTSCTFFRRQQIGLPFSASVDRVKGKIGRAEVHDTLPLVLQTVQLGEKPAEEVAHIPLATISILLVQRSARLTFVERLLAEDLVMRSFHHRLSSPYRYFDARRDIGLLTDGWGDLFLVLFASLDGARAYTFEQYADKCDRLKGRFNEIITLRKSVFEDTLVVRSETSYTPLAADTALLNPNDFRCTVSIRLRATLDGRSLSDEFERHMSDIFNEERQICHKENKTHGRISDLLSYSRVAGRTDYVVSTKTDIEDGLARAIYSTLCDECENYDAYGIIFETLRRLFFRPQFIEDHVDSTATAIAELKFPMH